MMPEHKTWRSLLRPPPVFDADALWSRVAAGRARRQTLRRVGLPALAVALGSVLLLFGRGWFAHERPLARVDGGTLDHMEADAQPRELALSDGSRIALAPGARLVTRALTPTLFETELAAGKVVFDVEPHGPRAWQIKAGTTEVRVLGTQFSVERSRAGVVVRVERGVVQVSGPQVPGGSQRLQAGEALRTSASDDASQPAAAESAAAASGQTSAAAGATPAAAAIPAPRGQAPAATAMPAPRDQTRAAADATLPPQAATVPPSAPHPAARVRRDASEDNVERCLLDADQARALGQSARAARLLARVIAEHPHDARAALAAFTLGELYLGPLSLPLRAAATFERAQALGLPEALAEVGAARRFEAYAAGGRTDAAASAAHAYLSQFPNGAHHRAAEQLTSAW